ncbi:MAG: bifunctional 4-hydroxy-2-oxoglutarate aldolase/2-dehydro-3-deoxy-phosphogluconate aldolase, partial [Rubrobacteraceae bacterium]
MNTRRTGSADTLNTIRDLGVVAVVRGATCADAIEVSNALIEGGVLGIEVTFTTPEAHRAMRELNEQYGDRILLGAGTLTIPEQVDLSVAEGARFLVSPGCDPELLSLMQATELAVLPGVMTPSEVMLAGRLGVEVVKLFPGSLGGPSYLKALKGPFPEVSFVPTGGVSAENIADWFAAGAFAVGVGGALAPSALGGDQERERVVDSAKQLMTVVR